MPGNRAISYNPAIEYGAFKVASLRDDLGYQPWAVVGELIIVATKLAEDVKKAAGIAEWDFVELINPEGLVCAHPLRGQGYEFDVPLLAGDHVTDDAGTGFVHTAPGHGADDYAIWIATGHREIPDTVDADGKYYPDVPLFGGMAVMETEGKKAGKFGPANGAVMDALIAAGNLLARGRLEHSYPHSWRSKAPVIFRNTPQWFIRMDAPLASGKTLRETALAAIDATAFHPQTGSNRLRSMVENRPDWLVSRQRAWGTPLALFVDKRTREPLQDEAVNARIAAAIESHGAARCPTSSARTIRSASRRSRTSSTSGSIPARPTPSPSKAWTAASGPRTSIWKAPTSIGAGSSPPCWRAAAPAAGRRSTPF